MHYIVLSKIPTLEGKDKGSWCINHVLLTIPQCITLHFIEGEFTILPGKMTIIHKSSNSQFVAHWSKLLGVSYTNRLTFSRPLKSFSFYSFFFFFFLFK